MKFDVTPELASLLKTLRAKNGRSSKEVAEYLGKSPSYLSKLEGGSVQAIESDVLKGMMCFIEGGADFYSQVLPDVANLLFGLRGSTRVMDQPWFLQFDVIERPVEVPQGMADDLRAHFQELGMDASRIAIYVNANYDSELDDSVPANQVIRVNHGDGDRLLIRPLCDAEQVEGVLSGRDAKSTYHFIYNLVHTMFRMSSFPGVTSKLPPAEAITLLSSAAEYMGRWEIHSLVGFSHLLSSDEFIAHQLPLSNAQDGVVERLAALLSEAVEHDSLNALNDLNSFYETLDWDPAFAIRLMGLPFSKLGSMSYANKRKLMGEIRALLDRYDGMDEFQRKLETY